MEASVGRRRRPRVLVIEDDARIRDLFCEWLGAMDCDAMSAANGEEGVRLFDRGGCDLVVTDLMMPGLTGWQVVVAVRRRDPSLPVILITGSATNVDPEQLKASRVTLLEKPLSLMLFKATVTDYLKARLTPPTTPCPTRGA